MNDVFRAIYQRLAAQNAEGDAFNLVGGRVYRTRAPKGGETFPYIVVSHIGGAIDRIFGGDALEGARLQFTVFDDLRGDEPSRADAIYEALVANLEDKSLTCLINGVQLRFWRTSLPREVADETVISKSGDWVCERLMHR